MKRYLSGSVFNQFPDIFLLSFPSLQVLSSSMLDIYGCEPGMTTAPHGRMTPTSRPTMLTTVKREVTGTNTHHSTKDDRNKDGSVKLNHVQWHKSTTL